MGQEETEFNRSERLYKHALYQKLWYRKKKKMGLCQRCNEPIWKGKSCCEKHFKEHRDRNKERYYVKDKINKRKIKMGLCISCDDPIWKGVSKRFCEKHAIESREKNRFYGGQNYTDDSRRLSIKSYVMQKGEIKMYDFLFTKVVNGKATSERFSSIQGAHATMGAYAGEHGLNMSIHDGRWREDAKSLVYEGDNSLFGIKGYVSQDISQPEPAGSTSKLRKKKSS